MTPTRAESAPAETTSIADGPVARVWHGVTAVVVLVGVVLALALGGPHSPDDLAAFPSDTLRALNVLVYFTIQSNLIVGITALLLALRTRRSALLFKVFRFDGIAMIVLTAAVYHTMLAGIAPQPTGLDAVDNQLLHTVVPLLAVVGWLVFGPRGLVTWKVVWLSLLYPIAWLVFTVVRGAVIDWYPYPFMDPRDGGYLPVALTLAGIVAGFIAMAALLLVADRALARLARPTSAAAAPDRSA